MPRFSRPAAVSCIAIALLGFAVSPSLNAAHAATRDSDDAAWTQSFDGAKAQANAGSKLILADFTGSDWCHSCVQLKREVLDTPEFKNWAADRLVLLELDYPRKRQPDEIKRQNARLKDEFRIDGYPTVVIMNAEGKELGRIDGYRGAEQWSTQVRKIVDRAK